MTPTALVKEGNAPIKPYGLIYCATNKTNGKKYVGQTVQTLDRRKKDHWSEAQRHPSKTYFWSALVKYGLENFDFEEIDTGFSKDELDYLETYWIRYFDCLNNQRGYNLKEGGVRGKHGLELRERASKRLKGVKNPAHSERMKKFFSDSANRKKYSDAKIGRPNPEHGKRMKKLYEDHSEKRLHASVARLGQRSSPSTEFKPGLIPFNKGIERPKEWCLKQSQTHLRKIINAPIGTKVAVQCIETGKIYDSIKEACSDTGTNRITLSKCLKGESKTTNKLHWRVIRLENGV